MLKRDAHDFSGSQARVEAQRQTTSSWEARRGRARASVAPKPFSQGSEDGRVRSVLALGEMLICLAGREAWLPLAGLVERRKKLQLRAAGSCSGSKERCARKVWAGSAERV